MKVRKIKLKKPKIEIIRLQKIDCIKFYYFILLFIDIPYIKYLYEIPTRLKIFLYLIALIMGLLLTKRKKIKIEHLNFYLFSLMYATILVSTVINKGSIISCVSSMGMSYLICMVFHRCDKKQQLDILNLWKKLVFLLLVIDIITYILYPKGLFTSEYYTNNWFLGYKTERLIWTFPMLISTAYIDANQKSTITNKTFIYGGIVLIDTILSGGSVASATVILYLAFLVMLKIFYSEQRSSRLIGKIFRRIFDYRIILIIYAVLFVFLVIIQKMGWMQVVIAGFFDKSTTFTGRTAIWTNTYLEYIKSPIIGRGFLRVADYLSFSGNQFGTNAHDYGLTILISGGILAIIELVVLYIHSMRRKAEQHSISDMTLMGGIYSGLVLGIASSILAFAPFTYLPYILL